MSTDVSTIVRSRLLPWRNKDQTNARPLTTDERVWLFILSLYMAVFCISSFVYWDVLVVKVIGVTAAVGGLFMFIASFFDPEARGMPSEARHPVIWYVFHILVMLGILFGVRFVGGMMNNQLSAVVIIYGGLLATLVIFRKELIQLLATLFAVLFLVITITHWDEIVVGHMKFRDAARQCSLVAFRLGPMQELKNLILTGNYMGYLTRIEYRNPEINIRASRLVAGTADHEVRKAERILDFVSQKIEYISDPQDGVEFPKEPMHTLRAGAGDCEDQTLLLCSMLETVGVKSYIVFTADHVFAVVQFDALHPDLNAQPFLFIDAQPCYAMDPARPTAQIGDCTARPEDVEQVFDIRRRVPVEFRVYDQFSILLDDR